MKIPEHVTTDCDLWNSADVAHFFVTKGQVKRLPEELSPIMMAALEQHLLREPTCEEMSKYMFENDIEKAIQERRFSPGGNYEETVRRYNKYMQDKIKEPAAVKEIAKEIDKQAVKKIVEEKEEIDFLKNKKENKK